MKPRAAVDEDHAVLEQVVACMETGNHSQARTLLVEYGAVSPVNGAGLRVMVIRDYGIDL